MNKIRIAKIAGIAVGATVAFGALVPMAGAVTIAELQAQINALMAQLAALQGGTVTTGTTACTFTRSLTMGSQGADVTCLQNYLTGTGHFTFAGGATGYFGSVTKAAVAAWQAANGVAPAVGYFGPISQARYSAVAATTGGTTGSTTTGGTTTTGGITTPGVEGTITVSLNPSPAGVKLYEGDMNKDVFGIKLEAKSSDIKIERVKLKLDENDTTSTSDTDFYRKIANKVYIKDGSTVLGSADLNINTVVKDGTNYYITVSGLNFVVPKNSTKVLTVALDALGAWDDTFNGDSWRLTVPVDGIRGVDGAAVNQYGPATAFNRDFTSESELSESATLAVSLNSGSPLATQVICTSSSTEDECDELELLRVDFRAEKDNVTLTDLIVDINMTGGDTATATTAWLYDGTTKVGSATIVELTGADSATFTDIDYVIPVNTTKTLSVKVDIRGVDAASNSFAADIDTADVTSENAAGTGLTESGSAQGKTIEVRKVGPQITLTSKSVTTSGVPQGAPFSGGTSTSTLTATFNLKIKALGGDLVLGTVASGTPLFASSTGSFALYRNGTYDGSLGSVATSTSYSIPSACVSTGTNSCVLAENAEVTVPVTWKVLGRTKDSTAFTAGSLYAVGLEGFEWIAKDVSTAIQRTTFMATTTDWRTDDVSFP
ncbi:MAG: peptidoglycan-binding protein [Candidatus Zambryskibacteria bacterium]|nr:peptidoglycan-binding protein [Candidatus Zambryskibacteria bacterium]